MNLYTIDKTIEELIENGCSIDEKTGEYFEFDDLRELKIDRDKKIDNTVCFMKNTEAMIKALKEQEKEFAERRKILENKISRIKGFLGRFLEVGKKLETVKYKISWRKSESIEVIDNTFLSSKYANREITIKPDKKAIKQALKDGIIINGVELKQNNNLQIK